MYHVAKQQGQNPEHRKSPDTVSLQGGIKMFILVCTSCRPKKDANDAE